MFIFRLIAVTLALLGATFLINVAVDPYGANGTGPTALGRKLTETWVPDFKFSQVAHAHPTQIVLGNSRAWMGISPGAIGLTNAYNFAAASLTIGDMADQLQFAQSCGALKTAYILLDLNEFEANRDRVVSRFAANSRKCSPGPFPTPLRYIQENISARQLLDSLLLLARPQRSNYASDGTFTPPPGDESEATAAMYAEQKLASYLVQGWDYDFATRRLRTENSVKNTYDDFSRLLEFAAANRIRLVIIFAPLHAQLQVVAGMHGMRDAIWDWKKQVLERAEAFHRSQKLDVRLYDFLSINELTRSPLAESRTSSRPSTSLYYEPSHFRPVVGTRIFGEISANPGAWELTSANLSQRRQGDEIAYRQYLPEAGLVRKVAQGVCRQSPSENFCATLKTLPGKAP